MPIFRKHYHRNITPDERLYGLLVGYAVRLTDYNYLAHSSSVRMSDEGQYRDNPDFTESLRFQAPAELDVEMGNHNITRRFNSKLISSFTGMSPLSLYFLYPWVNLVHSKFARGVNKNPPRLQSSKSASTKNCYAMHYSFSPGDPDTNPNHIRRPAVRLKRHFVHSEVEKITCQSNGSCNIRLANRHKICKAPYEAGAPVICDGFLSYIIFDSLRLSTQSDCQHELKGIRIADHYQELNRLVNRTDFCGGENICLVHEHLHIIN